MGEGDPRGSYDQAMAFPLEKGTFDALIFDCDGTLVDSAEAHFYSLQQALAPLGLTMTPEWYHPRHGLGPEDLLDAYEAEFKVESLIRTEFYERVNHAYLASVHLIQEIKVVTNVAREWFGRVPMAVASNGVRKNVEATLIATRLRPLFYTLVTADDVEHGKPAPDVYLEAARRLRVNPDRAVVFEDSDEGLEAARRAGMRAYDIRQVWSPMRQSHGMKL